MSSGPQFVLLHTPYKAMQAHLAANCHFKQAIYHVVYALQPRLSSAALHGVESQLTPPSMPHRRPDLQGGYQLIRGKVEVLCQQVGHMPLMLMPLIVGSLVRMALPHQLPEVTTRELAFKLLQPCMSMHDPWVVQITCSAVAHRNNSTA